MRLIASAITMLAFVIAGCSGEQDADTTATRISVPERMSGYLLAADGSYSWTSVDRADTLALTDQSDGQLAEVAQNFSLAPGAAMFVEVIGSQSSEQVILHDLLRAVPADMAASMRSADTLVFLSGGNEPFWSVELTLDSLVYRSPEEERHLALTDAASVDDSLWLFQASGPNDTSSVMVQIIRHPCYDSMSGAYSAFSATVLLWQRQLTGCAVKGLVDVPKEPDARE